MVQPLARIRFPDLRRGYAGYLRAHGNTAPLRDDRAAPRPVRAGPVLTRLQGNDGRGNPAGKRLAGTVVALTEQTSSRYRYTRAEKGGVRPADGLVFAKIIGIGSNPANPLRLAVSVVHEF